MMAPSVVWAQQMVVSQTVGNMEVAIDASLKFKYVGSNELYIAQGSGICMLKSSSDARIVESGQNDGSIMVNVDPATEYDAQVIMTCIDGTNVQDTNQFRISVKCMADTANIEFSDVLLLTLANEIQYKPNEQCYFHFFDKHIKSTSVACPVNKEDIEVFKDQDDLKSWIYNPSNNQNPNCLDRFTQTIIVYRLPQNYEFVYFPGIACIQSPSYRPSNQETTFQIRASHKSSGAHLWSPKMTLKCPQFQSPQGNYFQTLVHIDEADLNFAVLQKGQGIIQQKISEMTQQQYAKYQITNDRWNVNKNIENNQRFDSTDPYIKYAPQGTVQSPNDILNIDTTNPFKQKMYIRAKSINDFYSIMAFYITVCGNERLKNNLEKDPYFLFSGETNQFTVDFEHWFKNDYDPTTMTKECFGTPSYSLCLDNNCATPYTGNEVILTDTKLTINAKTPTSLVSLYLQKKITNHQVSQKFSYKVCGYENVKLLKDRLDIASYVGRGDFSIDIQDLFSVSDNECPIKQVKITQNNQDYQGDILTFNQATKKFNVKTSKLVDNLQLKIQTFYITSQQSASLETSISIDCSIKANTKPQQMKFHQNSAKSQSIGISQFFEANITDMCPIISFKINSVVDKETLKPLKNFTNFISVDNKGKLSVTDTSKSLRPQIISITASNGLKISDSIQVELEIFEQIQYFDVPKMEEGIPVFSQDEFPQDFLQDSSRNEVNYIKFFLIQTDEEVDIATKYIKPIESLNGFLKISNLIADEMNMDRLNVYQTKKAIIFDVDQNIRIKFNQTALSKTDVADILGKPLDLNFTTEFQKTQYNYSFEISFGLMHILEEKNNSVSQDEKAQNSTFVFNITQDKADQKKRSQEEQKELMFRKLYGEPRVRKQKITNELQFKLQFNQPMNFPWVKNGILQTNYHDQIKLSIISGLDSTIEEGTAIVQGHRLNWEQQESKLKFSWEIDSFSDEYVQFKIYPDYPEEISRQGGFYDLLAVDMQNLKLIGSLTKQELDMNLIIPQDCYGYKVTFCQPIPPIMMDKDLKDIIDDVGNTSKLTIQTLLSGNILFSFIFGGSLQEAWGLLRAMQLINMLSLASVTYPYNVFNMLQITNEIAALDIMKGEERINDKCIFKETTAPNSRFESFGIDNMIFLLNAGSIPLIVAGILIKGLFYLIVNQIAKIFFRYKFARQVGAHVYKSDMGMQLLIIAIEGYIDICFCTFLNLNAFFRARDFGDFLEFFSSGCDVLSSFVTLTCFGIIIALPIFILVTLVRNKENLSRKDLKKRYGHFYNGLHTTETNQLIYQFYFMLKRLVTTFAIIFMRSTPYFQMQIFIVLQLAELAYLVSSKPFRSSKNNIIEILNQITVMLWCYMQDQLLNISLDSDGKDYIGLSMIIICLVNIIMMLIDMIFSKIFECWKNYNSKDKNINKTEIFDKKLYEKRLNLIKRFPGAFIKYEHYVSLVEATQRCKEWKYYRDWLEEMKLPFHDLREEMDYQSDLKKFNLKQKLDILLNLRQDMIEYNQIKAAQRKNVTTENVRLAMQIQKQEEICLKEEKNLVQHKRRLSMFGKDPKRVLKYSQNEEDCIKEEAQDLETENADVNEKRLDSEDKDYIDQLQEYKLEFFKDKIIPPEYIANVHKPLRYYEYKERPAIQEVQELEDEIRNEKLKISIQDEIRIDEANFMNDSEAEEFDEEKFGTSHDFASGAQKSLQIELKVNRGFNRELQYDKEGILGFCNSEGGFSHLNSLIQCLLAISPLKNPFTKDWHENLEDERPLKYIAHVFQNAFSFEKSCNHEDRMHYLNLKKLKQNIRYIQESVKINDPYEILQVLVGLSHVEEGPEEYLSWDNSNDVIEDAIEYNNLNVLLSAFRTLIRMETKCKRCKNSHIEYTATLGIEKLPLKLDGCSIQKPLELEYFLKRQFGLDRVQPKKKGKYETHCYKCKKNDTLDLKKFIVIPPKILLINLDRLDEQNAKIKTYQRVILSKEIDLKFLTVEKDKQRMKSIPGAQIINNMFQKLRYKLIAFIAAEENQYNKQKTHFVAYCLREFLEEDTYNMDIVDKFKVFRKNIGKTFNWNQWYEFNDEIYRPMDEKKVLEIASMRAVLLVFQHTNDRCLHIKQPIKTQKREIAPANPIIKMMKEQDEKEEKEEKEDEEFEFESLKSISQLDFRSDSDYYDKKESKEELKYDERLKAYVGSAYKPYQDNTVIQDITKKESSRSKQDLHSKNDNVTDNRIDYDIERYYGLDYDYDYDHYRNEDDYQIRPKDTFENKQRKNKEESDEELENYGIQKTYKKNEVKAMLKPKKKGKKSGKKRKQMEPKDDYWE